MEPYQAKAVDRIKRAAASEQLRADSPASGKSSPSRAAEIASEGTEPRRNPDQRKAERRETLRSRMAEPPLHVLIERELFPRAWPLLVLTMLGSIVAAAFAAGSMPGALTYAMLVVSILCVLPVKHVWKAVAGRSLPVMISGAAVVVVVPLFLFGMGMVRWIIEDRSVIDVSIAAMLSVSLIAVVYLRRQPAMICVAQLAIWSAGVFVFDSVVGVLALLGGLVVTVLISREQMQQRRIETQFKRFQERIATRAQDILTDYEETGQGWFWETDRRALLTYVSPPVAEALRLKPYKLLGQPLTRLFDLAQSGKESERTLSFHLSARSSFSELSMRAAIADEERWWSVSGRPLYDHFDNFIGFRGSGTDLTERKRSQESANRLARYDSLTGLANRYTMSQSLEKILFAPHAANRFCGVFLLDLDRFKQVNDTMGHPAGDALLKQVAQRLERTVGRLGQVGRLGGDEFKVIVPTRVKREKLADLGCEIINSLSQPYSIDGQRVVIGASVGIALAPDDGATSEEIIRNADLALYAAKDRGRGRYHFYSQELHADAEARSQMEADLRDALGKGELQMFYQPVVATATDSICGFEALMRWQHPVKGWVPPQRFIESAEDSGMIQQLGEWALRQACEQLAQWPKEIRVAVNVSPLQFANQQLPSIVANAIAQSGIKPSQLELEITETVFLQDGASTEAMFTALKNLGVRLALDDFGTGYSSLGYLKKAPFDKIKIDQSFVRGITEEGNRNGAIFASITSLAKSLGMETTAEGVETMDELEQVRMHGCSHVQGFIYERPLDAQQAHARLDQGLEAVARGPRCSRASRQTMLRKVVLDHDGHVYKGTIRNISTTGAMIVGLWNVPVGTIFKVQISQTHSVSCTARWSEEDRMGVEFANALQRDASGQIAAIEDSAPMPITAGQLRKAG